MGVQFGLPSKNWFRYAFQFKRCPNCSHLLKDAVKHRSLYLKPLSQSTTVVLQNCDDEVMNRYPIFNLPSHFTTVAKVKNLGLLWSSKSRRHWNHSQHTPWNGACVFSPTSALNQGGGLDGEQFVHRWYTLKRGTLRSPCNEATFEKVTLIFYRTANILKRYISCDSPKQGVTSEGEALIQGVITFAVQRFIFDDWDIANCVNGICNFSILCPWITPS